MKRLFILSFLFALSVSIMAQSGSTVVFNNATYAKYTPVASDTSGGAATKYWTFFVDKPELYFYVATCQFNKRLTTSRLLGNHVTLTLSGSIDGTNYVTIDTTLFHPTTGNYGMETVKIPASDVATGVLWRYMRFTAVGGDANKGATLASLALKIGLKK